MSFKDIVEKTIIPIGNGVIGLLYAVAFLIFIYGVFRYFFAGGEKGKTEGRGFIIWGIFSLAILFSVWGIVHLGTNFLAAPGA
jgi:hypothetical protein